MSLILDGSNGLSDVDGSAATPAIRGTDANTGIFFPAVDTIAFSTGGAGAMRINSSGFLGIGTTTPVYKLDVRTTVDAVQIHASNATVTQAVGYCSSGLAIAGAISNHPYSLITNNTEQMRIGSDGIITGTAGNLMLVSGTAQATTSGTFKDFTGIPSWVKRITVMFAGVSGSGTSSILVQLGTSSGVVTSGYASTSISSGGGTTASTAGFSVQNATASNTLSGIVTIILFDTNAWVSSHSAKTSTTITINGGGNVTNIGGTLDRVRITTVNGTDTFDAGTINILYE